jgi:hypothetical protein
MSHPYLRHRLLYRMEHMNVTDIEEIGQAEIMYMDNHEEIDIEGVCVC